MQETCTIESGSLVGKINQVLAAGRPGPAKPLLAALRHIASGQAVVAEIAARLAILQGDLESAQSELDHALATNPTDPTLLRCRADLHHRRGNLTEAARDAADAVIADPKNPTGKAILGILMVELGRPRDAIACLTEAVAANPGEPSFQEGLARAQAADSAPEVAATTLAEGIAAAPGHTGLRNAAVLLACRRGRFQEAVTLAEAARRQGHADACLFGLKAHALSCLGRHQEAGESYAEALKLGPADAYVRHLVATTGAVPSDPRAPSDYVQALFDGYAPRFEASLLSLGYRIPGVIRKAVKLHVELPETGLYGPALDLGCGTGLVAVALHDLPVGPIHGVDISPRMLEIAAGKQLYATLRESDLLDALMDPGIDFQRKSIRRSLSEYPIHAPKRGRFATHASLRPDTSPAYRLIFAADVLCYLGALDQLLPAAFSRLGPGGLMLASIEEASNGRGWSLGTNGRYAHSPAYLVETAGNAGFEILALDPEVIRHEPDGPVRGRFAVLRRPLA